ncbi:MAG: cyclic nucleotide-binding domain-containing protein [Thermodesulfobacteriota bacterium]
MSERRQLLKKNELLASLDDAILDEFTDSAREQQFAKGDILTAELVHGDEIYLILEGEISIGIELAGGDSDSHQLTEGAGQFVGLIHFLEETPSHATEIAVTDVKVLAWKASDWRDICERHPKAGYRIAVGISKMLVQRMLHFNMHMLDSMSWGI